MNDQTYYIIKGDQKHGPLYDTDILQWLNAGQIGIADLVLRHSDNKWIPVAELFPAYISPPPQKRSRGKYGLVSGCLLLILSTVICCGCYFISDAIFLIRCQGSGNSYAYCSDQLQRVHEWQRRQRR